MMPTYQAHQEITLEKINAFIEEVFILQIQFWLTSSLQKEKVTI